MTPRAGLFVAVALAVAGCSGTELVIDLKLARGFDPIVAKGAFVVTIVVDGTGAAVATSPQVDFASLKSGNAPLLFEGLHLDGGQRYRIGLRAKIEVGCASKKAVGLSAPFTYADELARVAIYIDCADRSSVAGKLETGRLYHTATFLPGRGGQGRVVIAGGARFASLSDASDPTKATFFQSIEVYDPATGVFTPSRAVLARPRIWHAATAVGDDDVVFSGGVDVVEVVGTKRLVGLRDVERLSGDRSTKLAPLVVSRAGHAAIRLRPDRLLFAGGLSALSTLLSSAEMYDPGKGESQGTLKQRMAAGRMFASAEPLGDGKRAVIFGGGWFPSLQLRGNLFCLEGNDCGCAAPCFKHVDEFPRGEARNLGASAVVPCSDGKSAAVYFTGGRHGESKPQSIPSKNYGDIYCYDSRTGAGLKRVGALRVTRSSHTATTIRGPSGKGPRIFVAGGSDGRNALDSGEVFEASCTCGDVKATQPVKLAGQRLAHTATLLADGSVLLVGGAVGADSAERFIPDL